MDVERLEPVLRLLDDPPFHRRRTHCARLTWWAGGIALLATAVYLPTLCVGGFAWHDQATLGGVTSWFQLVRLWTWASGAFRPLGMSLLWSEHRLFGQSVWPYHIVSIVAHAMNAVLLWLVLRRLEVRGGWLAAALFAVHPVQVQSVAWISQQPLVLCTTFYVLAIWVYLGLSGISPRPPVDEAALNEPPGDDRLGRWWGGYAVALVCCAAAILCDPVGISLPLALALVIRWKRGPIAAAEWRRLAPFFAIALVGTALGVVFHHASPERLGVAPSPSIAQRIVIAVRAMWFYAVNVVPLHPQQLIYNRWDPTSGFRNGLTLLLGAATLAALGWAARRWRSTAPVILPALFVALLLPGLATVLADAAPAVYVADCRQYLASAVPFMAVALLLVGFIAARFSVSVGSARTARAAIGFAVLGPLAGFAIAKGALYRDALTPWRSALAQNPSDATARSQFALQVLEDEPDKALQILDDTPATATADDPTLLDARARVCVALGRNDEAVAAGLQCQRLAPDDPGVRALLAEAYDAAAGRAVADGRRSEATQDFDCALAACAAARELCPADASVWDGAGTVLLHEGRFADAIAQFDAALRLDAGCAAAHVHKAAALIRAGLVAVDAQKVTDADLELREALRIDPANAEAFRVAAEMNSHLRNFDVAEKECMAAIRFAPRSADAWTDLGAALSAQARFEEAARSFEKALKLRPGWPAASRGKRLAEAQLASANRSIPARTQ